MEETEKEKGGEPVPSNKVKMLSCKEKINVHIEDGC